MRILHHVERDGSAHSPQSISFPLISIRDQLIRTSTYHPLHTVCCSEARGLRLGCWEHIILRITDLIQHSRVSERAPQGTACVSPRGRRGSQRHTAGKARKMAPSAARVAGIASASMHASLHQANYVLLGRVETWVGFKDV